MKKEYDYLIVGSGLFGSVFASEMKRLGKRCLVIDKRPQLGGNIYCETVDDIIVHKYGAHIFHTNDEGLWLYMNKLARFNNYRNSPIANYQGALYNLPFNMNTFYQLWTTKTPVEAKARLDIATAPFKVNKPKNLEEQALSMVGEEIYEKFIKHYTEKQWGRSACELPAWIIKRIPLRFTYDNNYFNDRFQGIPVGGYNGIIQKLLAGIETKVNIDFLKHKAYFSHLAEKTVYSGRLDELYNFRFGELEFRSLAFSTERLEIDNFQGNAVVNFTCSETPYTRIYEHKHFNYGKQPHTVITKEYPVHGTRGNEPYYPINDHKNNKLQGDYKRLADNDKNLIYGGRLADYKYYDMHQVVAAALKKSKNEKRNHHNSCLASRKR